MSHIPLWKQFPHSLKPANHSTTLIDKLTAFDISTYFDPPKPKPIPRQVLVNLPLPSAAWKTSRRGKPLIGKPTQAWEHPNNQVQTAKYSLLTFVPRNLAEQFRRIANIFFLIIVILQFIPQFSQVSPVLSALPLFAVLAITAIKDAYEDVRRHAADYKTNHELVDTVSPDIYTNYNITKPYSEGINLTSIFNLFSSKSDSPSNPVHKRHWWSRRRKVSPSGNSPNLKVTDSKEAESNLKGFSPTRWQDLRVGDFIRLKNNDPVPADVIICATSDEEENVCFIETKNLDGETSLKSRYALPVLSHLRSAYDCGNAQDRKNRFIVENEAPNANMFSYSAALVFPDMDQRVPVDLESVLLRGTVIRNTEWVIGLIVLTGPDTKIMLNSNGTPSKRSKVERQMNPMVFINLTILALMCIFNAIATYFTESYYYDRNAYWSFGSNLPDDNPSINGLIGFANALVTYQNIVPISLYITIEFVRTLQAYFIWTDDELELNGRRTLARSWNLSDDLGQIQYIFSDKTGTLTQNLMQFRKCCVGGIVYQGTNGLGSNEEGDKDIPHRDSGDLAIKPPEAPSSGSNGEKIFMPKQSKSSEPLPDIKILEDLHNADVDQSRVLRQFFCCLGLCHTVLASEDEQGSIRYKAQSPDEAALVQAAADVGFVFRGRDKNIIRLQKPSGSTISQLDQAASQHGSSIHHCNGPERELLKSKIDEFELLEVNEFTSLRKRMSVVVQKLEGRQPLPDELYLYVKGADTMIFERLASGQDAIRQQTDAELEQFAAEGLRTLCLAYRKVSRDQLEEWSFKYAQARSQLGEGREELIAAVQDELERDLILLGATAIEDKLQDGVPETISDLKRAGIKVWVATGDKLETAVAIAKSCNLIGKEMNLIVVRGGAYGQKASAYHQIRRALINFFDGEELVNDLKELPPSQLRRASLQSQRRPSMANNIAMCDDIASLLSENNGKKSGGYALIIDGSSLNHALEEKFTKEALLELSTRCSVVVCCRTSPKQKAEIVKLIKEGINVQTLAIGDGANDVSMIQTADIGVGVLGEEGLQAVNSSDYSICQFKFISKLLFVHGHWSYDRNSKMIVHFFYQEIIGVIPLFIYQFWCAYSTTTLFEYTYLLFYNVVWVLLPVIGMGVFEQDIRQEVLKQVPELYACGREGKLFGTKRFIIYMMEGIYQGIIIYIFLAFTYDTTSTRHDGFDIAMDEFSTVVIVSIICACNFFHALEQLNWNWWVLGCMCFGTAAISGYTAVYAAILPDEIWTTVYGNNNFLWPSPYWWLGILFSIVVSLLPRYVFNYYLSNYHPTDIQILREFHQVEPNVNFRLDDPENMKFLGLKKSSKTISESFNRMKNELEEVQLKGVDNLTHTGNDLTRSRTSLIHDMATGQLTSIERGFNFDQADGVGECAVGSRLRRYNSSVMSLTSPTDPRTTSSLGGVNSNSGHIHNDSNSRDAEMTKFAEERSKPIKLRNLQFGFGRDNAQASSSKAHSKQTKNCETANWRLQGGNQERSSNSMTQINQQKQPVDHREPIVEQVYHKSRFTKRITEFLLQPYPNYNPSWQTRSREEIQSSRLDRDLMDNSLPRANRQPKELDMIREEALRNEPNDAMEGRYGQVEQAAVEEEEAVGGKEKAVDGEQKKFLEEEETISREEEVIEGKTEGGGEQTFQIEEEENGGEKPREAGIRVDGEEER